MSKIIFEYKSESHLKLPFENHFSFKESWLMVMYESIRAFLIAQYFVNSPLP